MRHLEAKFEIPASPVAWRKFGLLMGTVAAGVAAWGLWQDKWNPEIWLGVSGAFYIPALVHPPLLRYVNILWMLLAHALGAVVSRLILSLLFFGLLLPMGLVMRVFGKPVLKSPKRDSYWDDKVIDIDGPEDYENQF